jgi:hypothetical protein
MISAGNMLLAPSSNTYSGEGQIIFTKNGFLKKIFFFFQSAISVQRRKSLFLSHWTK